MFNKLKSRSEQFSVKGLVRSDTALVAELTTHNKECVYVRFDKMALILSWMRHLLALGIV